MKPISLLATQVTVLCALWLTPTAYGESVFTHHMEVEGRPELTCKYMEGVPVFVPTAWRVTLTVIDAGTKLVIPERWKEHGGTALEVKPPRYSLLSPAVAGTYELQKTGAEKGEVRGSIVVRVVETRLPDSKRRIAMNGNKEPYPDPRKSSSKRVQAHNDDYKPPLMFCLYSGWQQLEITPGVMGSVMLPRNKYGKKASEVFPAAPKIYNKLAMVRSMLKEQGLKPEKLKIVSGFRPPRYNRKVGGASYSRHIYGDAIDVIYDADGNDKMDDLSGDGRINRDDGIVLAHLFRKVEELGAAPGGIGVYEYSAPTSRLSHVHVDARGYVTRWGKTYRTRKPSSFRWWPKGEFEPEEENE